jgi:hypothetical protein
MTDLDGDTFVRSGNSDSVALAWITGITGGIVVAVIVSLFVAVIVSLVGYSGANLSAVPAPNPSALYQTVPVAPTPAPPPESPKP